MSGRFDLRATRIPGLHALQRTLREDGRGYLERMFCADELQALIPHRQIVQVNHTLTQERGMIRGLHFQHPPHAETRFVSCVRGEVFDVAVDLRRGSATFLQWHAEVLSADNHVSLVIPEGFAHGFQTLTDACEMLYFHTGAYEPAAEGGLNAQDPRLGIHWPLPVGQLSERDAGHPMLDATFVGVTP